MEVWYNYARLNPLYNEEITLVCFIYVQHLNLVNYGYSDLLENIIEPVQPKSKRSKGAQSTVKKIKGLSGFNRRRKVVFSPKTVDVSWGFKGHSMTFKTP